LNRALALTYQNHAAEVLSKAIAAFRAGDFTLPSLAFRVAATLEELSPSLPAEAARKALDCAYLIEEVNAVALENGVVPSSHELAGVESALRTIESLLHEHLPEDDDLA
jgi:hypothetical protein